MKTVVVLEPEEYEALIEVQKSHEELIRELDERVNDANALQEFVKDWLY